MGAGSSTKRTLEAVLATASRIPQEPAVKKKKCKAKSKAKRRRDSRGDISNVASNSGTCEYAEDGAGGAVLSVTMDGDSGDDAYSVEVFAPA